MAFKEVHNALVHVKRTIDEKQKNSLVKAEWPYQEAIFFNKDGTFFHSVKDKWCIKNFNFIDHVLNGREELQKEFDLEDSADQREFDRLVKLYNAKVRNNVKKVWFNRGWGFFKLLAMIFWICVKVAFGLLYVVVMFIAGLCIGMGMGSLISNSWFGNNNVDR